MSRLESESLTSRISRIGTTISGFFDFVFYASSAGFRVMNFNFVLIDFIFFSNSLQFSVLFFLEMLKFFCSLKIKHFVIIQVPYPS